MISLRLNHPNILLNDKGNYAGSRLLNIYSNFYNILYLKYDESGRIPSEHKYRVINFMHYPSVDDIINKIDENKFRLDLIWFDNNLPFNASQCVRIISECFNTFGVTMVMSIPNSKFEYISDHVKIPFYTFMYSDTDNRQRDDTVFIEDFQNSEKTSIKDLKDRLDTSLRIRHILGKDIDNP